MPLFIPSTTKKTTNEEVSEGLRRTLTLWGGADPGNDGKYYFNVDSKSNALSNASPNPQY
jgi:hypothetical protein